MFDFIPKNLIPFILAFTLSFAVIFVTYRMKFIFGTFSKKRRQRNLFIAALLLILIPMPFLIFQSMDPGIVVLPLLLISFFNLRGLVLCLKCGARRFLFPPAPCPKCGDNGLI